MSSNTDWRQEYREATAAPPRGAKERVWRRLQDGAPAPSLARWLVPALAVATAALVAVVLWPRTETRTWRTEGSVVSVEGARVSCYPSANTVTLEGGTLTASVWAGPSLHVLAHGKRVVVEAAVVVVSVAGDSVEVTPVQGSVLVDDSRVDANDGARAKVQREAEHIAALEPSDAQAQRATLLAERALEARRFEDAARAFDQVARSGSLGAEAALLRKGEVELRNLDAPARALSTFDQGDARFPKGSLAQERALSALEALVALRRWADVEARAARFLAEFPGSERSTDVKALRVNALFELDRRDDACREVRELTGDSFEALRARCSL